MNRDRCNAPMIDIEHYGEQLTGCIECNCWHRGKSAFLIDLSAADIEALHDGRQTRAVRRRNLAGDQHRTTRTHENSFLLMGK
jgi:hypothetical protein